MLYIHIPFCQKICPFCSFAVRKNQQSKHADYLQLLTSEMELYQEKWGKIVKQTSSVYIGGGTPSSLELKHVEQLLKNIELLFPLSSHVEITFEINPEDLTATYIKRLIELGINRFSLGIQSVCDDVLKTLERCHSAKQALYSLEILASTAPNYNVDLMFGIPNQTYKQWISDLKVIETFCPPHISLYGLNIEPHTAFDKRNDYKKWIYKHEELWEKMYHEATLFLHNLSIENYEVSNFAKKGFESRANLLVWGRNPYLGLGLGAHSFFNNRRQANTRSLHTYQKNLRQGKYPIDFEEKLSSTQNFNEQLTLGLRQRHGFDIAQTQQKKWQECQLSKIENLCLKEYTKWQGSSLVLTTKGLLLADAITVELALE